MGSITRFRLRARRACAMLSLALLVPSNAVALDVWVDFVSDFHNGLNGSSNGVADWIDELNQATAAAGVAEFTAVERATIEASILSDLTAIYAEYDVDFVTSEPAGLHDVIYMARDNDHPDVSSSNLGSAPVDLANQDTDTYSDRDGNPDGVPKVTTGNFDGAIETSDSRATQIEEIATQLAGTAAHEYGHSIGLLHHFVYSHPEIDPSNYDDTGGVQNQYILATGNTGISESERETIREFSPFSKVMLDIAGGSDASSFEENIPILSDYLVSDRTENLGADAGSAAPTAWDLTFEEGPTSGLPVSFLEADLDGSGSDVDVFTFTIGSDAKLMSHVFSERLDLGSLEFDPVLELLDSQGVILASVDDIGWDDDVYNDLISPEDDDEDPFLVNIPLTPGQYYLRVTATDVDVSDTPNAGDNYWLVTALDFEDPALPGDYNGDGFVDAGDYVVWRNTLGAEVAGPFVGADGDGDSLIGPGDFDVWTANYGAELTGGSATVPEPTAIALLAAAALIRGQRPSRPFCARANRFVAMAPDQPGRSRQRQAR